VSPGFLTLVVLGELVVIGWVLRKEIAKSTDLSESTKRPPTKSRSLPSVKPSPRESPDPAQVNFVGGVDFD